MHGSACRVLWGVGSVFGCLLYKLQSQGRDQDITTVLLRLTDQ
ncbi:hypothetical protein KOXY103107_13900 [Komagataeibacter xylinus]